MGLKKKTIELVDGKLLQTQSLAKCKQFNVQLKNQHQKDAWEEYQKNDILFLIGAAGTGKSHCAITFAVHDILQKLREKIVLCRPIVESGEKLGFLPGDVSEKVAPYMAPMYDILSSISGKNEELARQYINKRLELAPLAYCRGRSQPLETIVLTPNGPSQIGSLVPGSLVLGSNGDPIVVEQIFPQGKLPVYTVNFSDGTHTNCSLDHLWLTKTKEASEFTVKSLHQIIKEGLQHFHEIPVMTSFTKFNNRIISENPKTIVKSIIYGENNVLPEEYLYNTMNLRIEVLKSYLELTKIDDNTIAMKPHQISDFLRILSGLGGNLVEFRQPNNFTSFSLEEIVNPKQKITFTINLPSFLKKKSMYSNDKQPTKTIQGIRLLDKEKECVCIKVASSDHLYLNDWSIITHNTFNDAVCILDEAQNCTKEQIKLFLTRIGENSKIIITGDPTQSDLPKSYLSDVVNRISHVPGVGKIYFPDSSIVRHKIISKIIHLL